MTAYAPSLAFESDASLIARIAPNNTMAFGTIFSRYHGKVYVVAFKFFNDEDRAADAVQDTFLFALNAILAGKIKHCDSIQAWLLTIARNACVSSYRKHKPSLFSSLDTDNQEGEFRRYMPATFDTPEAIIIRMQGKATLEKAIAGLSDAQRTAITDRVYDELKYREIAAKHNVSSGTVKTRIHLATKNLAKAIKKNCL